MKKLLALALLLPASAFAHDDHGMSLTMMLKHLFSSPEHMWPLTLGIVLVAVVIYRKRSK